MNERKSKYLILFLCLAFSTSIYTAFNFGDDEKKIGCYAVLPAGSSPEENYFFRHRDYQLHVFKDTSEDMTIPGPDWKYCPWWAYWPTRNMLGQVETQESELAIIRPPDSQPVEDKPKLHIFKLEDSNPLVDWLKVFFIKSDNKAVPKMYEEDGWIKYYILGPDVPMVRLIKESNNKGERNPHELQILSEVETPSDKIKQLLSNLPKYYGKECSFAEIPELSGVLKQYPLMGAFQEAKLTIIGYECDLVHETATIKCRTMIEEVIPFNYEITIGSKASIIRIFGHGMQIIANPVMKDYLKSHKGFEDIKGKPVPQPEKRK